MVFGSFPYILKSLAMFMSKFESNWKVGSKKLQCWWEFLYFSVSVPVQKLGCTGTACSSSSSSVETRSNGSFHLSNLSLEISSTLAAALGVPKLWEKGSSSSLSPSLSRISLSKWNLHFEFDFIILIVVSRLGVSWCCSWCVREYLERYFAALAEQIAVWRLGQVINPITP